ncbi:hypothetical protein [Treponema saccharophilum]|jgi:hypothetical protein|uniref:Lipoprotein n=2 Tax=Treponema TaxID=157 RepID=H7EPM2_9SPIR|nr:hypothetical protein [Treponema saccharophilum]EIC00423.1 hypothetical protein TresaDRAFT_0517 [Treponema saccharophilum DSM 2985]BDC94959.1 hypothetical protein TRSA_00580 [Treponema saccharophilum]
MKMTKFVAVAVAAAASLLASCGTTSNVNNVPMVDNETVMIDYQGKSMGGAIPKWVNAALDGTRSGVAKTLELDNKQLFVFIKKGTDLDFLQIWTDNVDVRAEVSNSFSQAVAQAADASIQASDAAGKQSKEKSVGLLTKTLSALELNGLLKEAQFWTRTRSVNEKFVGKKQGSVPGDQYYDYEYNYIVVFAMDKDVYQTQLDAALNGVEDNTSETELLKKALSTSLLEPLISESK